MSFSFYSPVNLQFGRGVRKEVGRFAKGIGNKCLIVRSPIKDKFREKYFMEMTDSLTENGIEYAVFDQVTPNPTINLVEKGSKLAIERDVDFVLGFGGGSSLDAAKAISFKSCNQDLSWEYCFDELSNPFSDSDNTVNVLPIIAVTTTSGTGSQLTQAAVISDESENSKMTIFHSNLFPRISFVDPELMVTVPKRVTSITGFDALSHAMESYFNPRASRLTTPLSLQAIEEIVTVLPKAIGDLKNVAYRERLAYADCLAGIGLSNAGAEAPHPIGEIINGFYPELSHGETLAFIYPAYLEYISDIIPEKIEHLLYLLKDYIPKEEQETLGEKAAITMANFLKDIELDVSLSSLKLEDERVNEMKERLCFNLPLTDSEGMQKVLMNSL